MLTMEDRWDKFDKLYLGEEFSAIRDSRDWIADMEYICGHISRIEMRCKRFFIGVIPRSPIHGMNDLIRESYERGSVAIGKEEALEKAFRMHSITLQIASKLGDELSEDNIAEWLEWKGVVYYFSGGSQLHIPSGMFGGPQYSEAWNAIEEADKRQPRCPKCDAVGWRGNTNNLGQMVFRCDSWMCGMSYTADTQN